MQGRGMASLNPLTLRKNRAVRVAFCRRRHNGAHALLRWWRSSSPWVAKLLERRPANIVAVALANKAARIAWAVITRGETYRRPGAAAAGARREQPAPRPVPT